MAGDLIFPDTGSWIVDLGIPSENCLQVRQVVMRMQVQVVVPMLQQDAVEHLHLEQLIRLQHPLLSLGLVPLHELLNEGQPLGSELQGLGHDHH